MIVEFGMKHMITYERGDGSTYTLPLLKDRPKILFKSENAPITLQFRFVCPNESCICRLDSVEKEKQGLNGCCPLQRSIKFIDSCLFIQTSLSNMVSDLHIARKEENISIESAFPATYDYCKTMNFSREQFLVLVESSLKIPYEYCNNFKTLAETITPPPPSAFQSLLNGKPSLTTEEYKEFLRIWDLLQVTSLWDLYRIYASIDVTSMADAVIFFFDKLHDICKLYPSHYTTISGLALASMLANCKSPQNKRRSIFIPFLSKDIYERFEKALIGGYSVNSCFFAKFNMGLTSTEVTSFLDNSAEVKDFLSKEDISTSNYVDMNQLYASCLQTPLPFRNFITLLREDNSSKFQHISKQLIGGNSDYFADKAKYEATGFFFECTMGYNHEDSLHISLDLSGFPSLKKVTPEDLSNDQKRDFIAKQMNSTRALPKLVSTLENDMQISDFSDSILFLIINQCCYIKEITSITIFEQQAFMSEYMNALSLHRAKSTTNIVSKLCKNLG